MKNNETYDFIGDLAIALFAKKIQISLSSLNSILEDKNQKYGSNRGLASAVKASYDYWKKKDDVTHRAIAYTFTNKNGELPWAQLNLKFALINQYKKCISSEIYGTLQKRNKECKM